VRCGSKRFQVELELDGQKQTKTVIAGTPAEARKTIRSNYGDTSCVISVRQESNR